MWSSRASPGAMAQVHALIQALRTIATGPDALAHAQAGHILMELQRFDAVPNHLQQAMALDPENHAGAFAGHISTRSSSRYRRTPSAAFSGWMTSRHATRPTPAYLRRATTRPRAIAPLRTTVAPGSSSRRSKHRTTMRRSMLQSGPRRLSACSDSFVLPISAGNTGRLRSRATRSRPPRAGFFVAPSGITAILIDASSGFELTQQEDPEHLGTADQGVQLSVLGVRMRRRVCRRAVQNRRYVAI